MARPIELKRSLTSTPYMATVRLQNCILFRSNPTETHDETGANILYYYPKASKDEQLRQYGITRALIEFSGNLCQPCRFIETRKSKSIISQVEPDYWIVLKFSNDNQGLDDILLQEILDKIYMRFQVEL